MTRRKGIVPSIFAGMKVALKAFGWLALLSIAVLMTTYFDWSVETIVNALLDQSVTYTGIGLAVSYISLLGVFFWKAQHRRRLIGILAIAFSAVELQLDLIGWDRLLALFLLALLIGVIVSVVRQNAHLFARTQLSRWQFLKLFLVSLALWSPSILFVVAGAELGSFIDSSVKRLIYSTPLIDQYCTLPDSPAFEGAPCSGEQSAFMFDEAEELGVHASVADTIGQAYLHQRRLLLSELERAKVDASFFETSFSADGVMQFAEALEPMEVLAIRATSTEGSEDFVVPRGVVVLRQQQEGLRRAIVDEQESLPSLALGFGHIQIPSVRLYKSKRELSRLQARLAEQEEAADELNQGNRFADAGRFIYVYSAFHLARESRGRSEMPPHVAAELAGANATGEQLAAVSQFLFRASSDLEAAGVATSLVLLEEDPDALKMFWFGELRCRKHSGNAPTDAQVVRNEGTFPCPPSASSDVLSPLRLRESLDMSVDRWFDIQEREVDQNIRDLHQANLSTTSALKAEAPKLLAPVPETIHIPRSHCGSFAIGCKVGNMVKGKAEGAYGDLRASLAQKYIRAVNTRADDANMSVSAQIEAARWDTYKALTELRQATKAYVARADSLLKTLGILSATFLALGIVKSFLYVFATQYFRKYRSHTVGLGSAISVAQAHAKKGNGINYSASDTLRVSASITPRIYLFRRALNTPASFLVPQPATAVLARLLTWTYFAGKTHAERKDPILYSPRPGEKIAQCTLEEGGEVVFKYRHLRAVSENVKLTSYISFEISALMLGRFIYHVARCERGTGLLVLSISGPPIIDRSPSMVVAQEALISWSTRAVFHVEGSKTVFQIFKDGYWLRQVKTDGARAPLLIGGAGDAKVLPRGLVAFVMAFLFPF